MQLILHAGAEADVASAGDWYEQRRPGLALSFVADAERAFGVIAEAPYTWAAWPGLRRAANVRRFLLSAFPFAIAYLIQPERDRVVVLAIAHASRHPDYWINRLDDPLP